MTDLISREAAKKIALNRESHARGETARACRGIAVSIDMLPAQAPPSCGWLYESPDTGTEYSEQHPHDSGEVEDAENVRPATAENLLSALSNAWEVISELRALPAQAPAPPKIDHTAAAADMLAEWDTWVSGQGGDKATAARLGRESVYAHAASLYAEGHAEAPFYTMRAFLQAMIDPSHEDLDYLREDGGSAILVQMMRAAASQIDHEAPPLTQ